MGCSPFLPSLEIRYCLLRTTPGYFSEAWFLEPPPPPAFSFSLPTLSSWCVCFPFSMQIHQDSWPSMIPLQSPSPNLTFKALPNSLVPVSRTYKKFPSVCHDPNLTFFLKILVREILPFHCTLSNFPGMTVVHWWGSKGEPDHSGIHQ